MGSEPVMVKELARYLPSTAVNTTLQLKELREQMLPLNIAAYIIPGTDAHLSEYIAPRDNRVAFMTGFTGSAGTAVVTKTKATLWTDSRYWVQAERQMDCNWELEKDVSIRSIAEWLIAEVPPGGEIGFDPFLFSLRLFNLRGNDIPYNPFFYSYTLLTMDHIWLFLHAERVTEELKTYLNASCFESLCVQLRNYDTVRDDLKNYVANPGVKVWIGTEYTNYALYELITPEVRDAVAVMQLLMWLEKAVPQGKETELTAAEYVNQCRSPTKETNRKLTVDEMYLVDSGGQYLDGTTDITRTVHWGTPTTMQREAFTRVLMGNIEISRTIFPTGTRGANMEMLGRRALWEVGLNYGHGTGHGVGNYFGVHEWPVGFQTNNIPFRSGMFTSIEPGYYKENDFGIRIEDVAVIKPVNTKYGNNYLTFDTVSLVPYDRKLIDTSLLSSEQIQWLNKYYETIRRLMGPELDKQGLHEEKDWMLRNTEPFTSGSSASVCSSSLTLFALAVALLHNIV
ncbi:Xaa-Pro aminopeptidase 2 [Collichthys lucidus]|uniref:Xaa-Pro aminopeptidase 2 n=2 Tax=Sciaenidae TaxID=30870 RepID=A0A4U5UCL0_COLLU|nr:Xaa-Pro aminopeptidase 2 [Collichthys lucidus]